MARFRTPNTIATYKLPSVSDAQGFIAKSITLNYCIPSSRTTTSTPSHELFGCVVVRGSGSEKATSPVKAETSYQIVSQAAKAATPTEPCQLVSEESVFLRPPSYNIRDPDTRTAVGQPCLAATLITLCHALPFLLPLTVLLLHLTLATYLSFPSTTQYILLTYADDNSLSSWTDWHSQVVVPPSGQTTPSMSKNSSAASKTTAPHL